MIHKLDHINIRTANLPEMAEWYTRVLQLQSGPRPDFRFPGVWLYADGQPLVHLIEVSRQPGADPNDLRLEHAAFSASGYSDFIALLETIKAPFRVSHVQGFGITQVNVWDPDGNHLHIDFDTAEVDQL